MLAEVDRAKEAGDSIGGSFVVVAERVPIGLGSSSEWDTRLDGLLAGAVMAIPGVKGVEIGLGFGVVERRGSVVHDVVDADDPGWARETNRAGGIEGGISNGAPIVVRAAQKPVSTLRTPLPSVDLATGEHGPRPHRAQRRHGPRPRRDRRRGDGGARPCRRAPVLVRRRHDRRPACGRGPSPAPHRAPRWRPMTERVVLVGMPASGKTTVGRILARKLESALRRHRRPRGERGSGSRCRTSSTPAASGPSATRSRWP